MKTLANSIKGNLLLLGHKGVEIGFDCNMLVALFAIKFLTLLVREGEGPIFLPRFTDFPTFLS